MKLNYKNIDLQHTKAILFDLGGVIVDISPDAAINAFSKLGLENLAEQISHCHHQGLFKQYESGSISTKEFIDEIQNQLPVKVDDHQVIDAWNAMLRDFPLERFKLIENLRQQFPIYLLSNTNEIHCKAYKKMVNGCEDAERLFTKAYYSFEIKQSKPSRESFNFVCEDTGLRPDEILFLDDSPINIDAAKKMGFKTRLVTADMPITKVFEISQ